MRLVSVVLILLFLWPTAAVGDVIWEAEYLDLTLESKDFEVFEDTTGELTLNQVLAVHKDLQIDNPGYNQHLESAYWLRFSLESGQGVQQSLLLEFLDPHVSQIEFFDAKGNLVGVQGTRYVFPKKQFNHKNHVFNVEVPAKGNHVYYARFKSDDYHGFSTRLHAISQFVGYSLSEYFLLGLFYGTLFIMALYNLVIFSFTRNSIRLYYALYVASCALITFAEDGLGFQFFWYNYPQFNVTLGYLWPVAFVISLMAYSFSFIDRVEYAEKFHKATLLCTVIFCGWYVISKYFGLLPRFWISIFILPIVLIYVRMFKQLLKGHRALRFLLIGSTLVIVGFVIIELRVYGVLENSIWQVYFFNFSAVLEVILFSMAIGDKIKIDQLTNLKNKELVISGLRENEELKDRVNRELENKISARTRELFEAKMKLETQAEAITKMNLELDVANRQLEKKIKNVAQKRILGEELDPEEFRQVYPDKLSCFQFIEKIKWGDGFSCRKCGNDSYSSSGSFRSRRCTKCGTIETPTAGTIFHGLRIPVESALYLVALIVQSEGKVSSTDLALKSGLGQKACWNFKQRVVERMTVFGTEKVKLDQLIAGS